jgi:hypothetical protein
VQLFCKIQNYNMPVKFKFPLLCRLMMTTNELLALGPWNVCAAKGQTCNDIMYDNNYKYDNDANFNVITDI